MGKMSKIIAGIDPGVKTGMALWDAAKQEFVAIRTMGIIEAMRYLRTYLRGEMLNEIWFEDARQRTWFGKADRDRLQGAGSIKRDCAIWQEFCEYYEIPFKMIKPAAGQTRWSAEYFRRLTGWKKRISQHARDAAALVFGIQ